MPDPLKQLGEDIFNLLTPERTLNFWQVVVTLLIAFFLGLIITRTYSKTHKGVTYSQSFCQTIIIMAMVISIIMIIIGSNIARAFSLVGALSIIRFRTAVKDARDTGFVFFAMAAGMACGTGFFLEGITMTLIICLVIILLSKFDYGLKRTVDKLLTVRVPAKFDYEKQFAEHFIKFLTSYSLVTVETVQQGIMTELTYNIRFKKKIDEQNFLNGVRQLNENNKVSLVYRDQRVDI
ncbi:MAG: DUF4956 domain-containing protein [Sedimentisphaerales bacterium]|nr:DUF4956 domain-containing protein [Sedimentisphaerales bacterium]